jgi:hypothetical protein
LFESVQLDKEDFYKNFMGIRLVFLDSEFSPLDTDTVHVCSPSAKCPSRVCAVLRRRFPVGASPTRPSLRPEATGAVMEVAKWLKPSV